MHAICPQCFGLSRMTRSSSSTRTGQLVAIPKEPITEIAESSDYHPSFEYFLGYEQVQATFVPQKIKRKRKGSEDDNGIVELLGKLRIGTNVRLDTLLARIGYEVDFGKARQEIFCHLGFGEHT
ncbi:hypothetical protein SASPL_130962 [Salvia splendens]|uniref:Uncharacterized protein n=1 Tax=Salvia splendens TaxID=180675 RepID=A0A8X8X6M9_SALSN|nr:hypothetical protein SASPL_130962 [Salvia splendens]